MNDKTKPGSSDTAAKAQSEDADTGKTLDELLAEYDRQTETNADSKQQDQTEIAELRAQVKALTEDLGERRYQTEMENFIIPTLKAELDVEDDYVEWWVNKQAKDDPRLQKLWDNRGENPKAFRQAIQAMTPEFQKHAEGKIVVKKKSRDSEDGSLANAVRLSRESDSPPSSYDDIDWGSLSDTEFQLKKQEVLNAAEQGKLK